jgi:quercetin dioxygenase-like cupin family protein
MLMTIVILSFIFIGFPVLAQQGFKANPVVKSAITLSSQKIEYPKTDKPEISALQIEIEPGGESGRHMHPVPTFVYVLEGVLTVEMDDGSRHEFQAGKGFLEVTNTWHNGKNMGKSPLKFLVVFTGEEGKPTLLRPENK